MSGMTYPLPPLRASLCLITLPALHHPFLSCVRERCRCGYLGQLSLQGHLGLLLYLTELGLLLLNLEEFRCTHEMVTKALMVMKRRRGGDVHGKIIIFKVKNYGKMVQK